MIKKTTLILLAVLLSTASLAESATSKNTAEPIIILSLITSNTYNKSPDHPISDTIDGHSLTIYINENVGIAHIVVTNSNGVYIDRDNLFYTPDMATLLIEDEGLYRVTITLSNSEVYYGDFTVTE